VGETVAVQHGDVIRRRVVVTGRVQGVGYRASVAREARAAGLSGFARNRIDGSVVVELEGRPAAVAAVVDWCRTGPSWSEVTGITVQDIETEGSTAFQTG
jgi:acylphosphatase